MNPEVTTATRLLNKMEPNKQPWFFDYPVLTRSFRLRFRPRLYVEIGK